MKEIYGRWEKREREREREGGRVSYENDKQLGKTEWVWEKGAGERLIYMPHAGVYFRWNLEMMTDLGLKKREEREREREWER